MIVCKLNNVRHCTTILNHDLSFCMINWLASSMKYNMFLQKMIQENIENCTHNYKIVISYFIIDGAGSV